MESTFNVASIWANSAQYHDVEATEKVDSTENLTALGRTRASISTIKIISLRYFLLATRRNSFLGEKCGVFLTNRLISGRIAL
jgi:hypothetical protein